MNPFHALFTTLAFFTRCPIPAKWQGSMDLKKSVFYYPLGGALIGLLTATVFCILKHYLPHDIFFQQLTLFLLPLLLSGTLHLDGLADSSDALFYAGTQSRRLEIMRDTKLGVYGVLALIVDLIIRWACISILVQHNIIWPVLLLPFIGKLGILFLLGLGSSPEEEGSISGGIASATGLLPAIFWSFVLAGLFYYRPELLPSYKMFLPLIVLIGFWAYKKIGAASGDLCGFFNELWELAFLIAFLHKI
jgi:adenosylcobinamide-GDP ribazoletransferase